MASFKGYGRHEGPARRRSKTSPRRQGLPKIEFLEERRLLASSSGTSPAIPPPIWTPTDSNLFDAQNGPMANLGTAVVGIYQSYIEGGDSASQLAAANPYIEFQNGMLGLQLKSLGGDFSQYTTQLTDLGVQITTSSAYYGLVESFVPINDLPAVATLPQTEAGQAIYYPTVNASEYQGEAYNEAETAELADLARTQFNVDGTGVTMGVLSDSVSQFGGGLPASYATGDLNPNNPVKVIMDGPAGSTDEGRAMLENIHDIAPGANLQFATADGGDMAFANNIKALAASGSQLISDDVSYNDEPMFQDGLISQAVDAVTAGGVTYFSAAGNQANDGYLSTFRAASGTVTGVGTGTFMNFAPSGATNLQLPITTSGPNAEFTFEFDQPFATQNAAGAGGVVTSNVYIYILNAAGAVVAVGNNNNVAMQEPWDDVVIPDAGSYTVAIQVISGANPGHVEFVSTNENVGLVVSQQYGSAGGTYYPTSFGHETAAATIGVGAVPWWAPASSLGIGQNPLASEPFSSDGPGLYIFNPDGSRISTGPELVQNPTVSGADGGNTSFFTPGQLINTTTPPFPGQPATPTNLVPVSQQNLPTFFGTSAAVENVASVAALMLQRVPNLTPAQIRQGLITAAEATPMNGSAAGTWNSEGGFGFVTAIDAINAVDTLHVASTNPANGSTVTITPSAITVTFNKAVNFSTVSAADLTFTAMPAGVTVHVGTPIAVDDPLDPTIIAFPFSFTETPGSLANGNYTFSIQSTSGTTVVSKDGRDLTPSGPISFKLADTTAPTVTSTSENGRVVTIQFSKALDPATVTLSNIFVIRQGPAATWPPTATNLSSYVDLNNDPRATISYTTGINASTGQPFYTVTLDYTGLPQTELPSDNYAIVVLSKNGSSTGVTDLVGNSLDGNFTGSFPSGQNNLAADFIQNLGFLGLQAPQITTFEIKPDSIDDTGIVGDQNTSNSQPQFIGQVYATFPGTVAGLQVYVQFAGLFDDSRAPLQVGLSGRGFTGSYDELVTTDANGTFTVTPPGPPNGPLPQGFQEAIAVVVGQVDQPPQAGLASSYTDAFRIDNTAPMITSARTPTVNPLPLPGGVTNVPSLTSLTLVVQDPVLPTPPDPLATPSLVLFQALNPATVDNISNYSLVNTTLGDANESSFISTANFAATKPTLDSSGNYVLDYNGLINLTFLPGLPAGNYEFIAHTSELQYPGLTDAAGNPLDESTVPGEGTKDFVLLFDIQPQPVYITSMALESTYSASGTTVIGGEQSYFELPPSGGTNTRDNVPAPPTAVVVDFSNPLPSGNYTNDIQLIQSATGDFGTLGQSGLGSSGTGFTILPSTDYTVTLYNYDPITGTSTAVNGTTVPTGNRLVLQLTGGETLAADDYRVYLPNQAGTSEIKDIYGNQLDGENLGNQTSQSSPDFQTNPITNFTLPEYQDLQSDGTSRPDDMSGDGVAGGAFMAGFTVVNYGNVIYARPDFVENPLLPNGAGLSTGTLAAPYPVLAPEGDPTNSALDANPTHNPNLGLNNPAYFQPGNFNVAYDRSGDGKYEQSALYAASQLSYASTYTNAQGQTVVQLGGPVVVVALPGTPSRNPLTGQVSQATFVLQAPAGSNATINNGSASVPFNTTLVFAPGSTLKLLNASLFVQNQGSALQAQGTSTLPVTFTSYNDTSVGGATNNNPDTNPRAGDWGGIVFRNYNDSSALAQTTTFPVDGTLVGPNGGAAVSGAQDAMSILNFANIRYAGGAVPQSSSNFYSAVTLYNSRPAVTNSSISNTGGTGGTEAAIGADMDSLREDDTARGPLIRNVSVTANSLNGLWLMSEANGFIEPTNAITYQPNPSSLGGVNQNYNLFETLPFIVLAQLVVGQELELNTGGQTEFIRNRLYIQPGVMIKFNRGSALDVLNPGSSLNVGSRSYINGFDLNNSYNPQSSGFVEESASDPTVLFTSIFDDTATTDLVPNPINVTGETTTPTLGPSFWGGVGIQSGALAVINAATFQYGGGAINTQDFSTPSQSVLAFLTFETEFSVPVELAGTHVYITNNNFFDNFDTAMQIEPDGLLAADPLRPLESGHPFFRGNVMQGNGIDGLGIVTDRAYFFTNNYATYIGPRELPTANGDSSYENQEVSAVWDSTDLTYVLRGTVILASGPIPTPSATTYEPVPTPRVTLTIQAALPGTLLADGETIPSPGQSVIVKLLNDNTPDGAGDLTGDGQTGAGANQNAGAGFSIGVDDGVDPPSDAEIQPDPGAFAELRILGIPGNQTTGQQRVPVIITSLRDDTVGTTVRGVAMFDILESDPIYTQIINPGASLTTPAPGDGGYIYIGGNSMPEYNATNPFDGSLIQDADISYLTRIEEQGAGLDYQAEGTAITAPEWVVEKQGVPNPIDQYNSPMMFTISASNLADFSDAGVFVHPESLSGWDQTQGIRSSSEGEGAYLYMYNDTISNSGQGVHINSETADNTAGPSPEMAVFLNDTFYNDPFAIQTIAPQFDGMNTLSSVNVLAMNDIFDGSSQIAVNIQGQAATSQLQYCLFYQNVVNLVATTTDADFYGNNGAVTGNPDFVGPVGPQLDAGAQNFELEPISIAIDGGRSEIGPLPAANAIYPPVNVSLAGGVITETPTNPATLPFNEEPGRANSNGGFGGIIDPRDIVTLPGSGFFSFPDEFVPVLTSNPNGYSGAASNRATYDYTPITGVRDILGFIRVPDLSVPGVGYGSNPFIDIGAYQYVNLHPPDVTAVTATLSSASGSGTIPFYTVGGKAGANQTPQTIDVTFNQPIDPNTLNASSVQLEELGLAPNTTQQFISLAGKLIWSPTATATVPANTLVIELGASGLTLNTDAYRLILFGSGSPVVANPQGIALDGENLSNGDDPNSGVQLPLPSGNGYPGGNFYDTFIINTVPPLVLAGSLQMDPASDTNIVGDNITFDATPTFDGTVSEPDPQLVPVAGQTAYLDIGIAVLVNGVLTTFFDPTQLPASLSSLAQFIRPNAGTALSTTGGAFQVTVGTDGAKTGLVTNTTPLPNLEGTYNVGLDGLLSPVPGDDSGYYVARVRIVDESGNPSNPSDPNAQLPFIVDTEPPTVTFKSPTPNQVFTSLTNNEITFTITTSENIDMTHFTTASIQVVNAGPDGILGTADDVPVAINPSSITFTLLDKGIGGQGAEQISFTTEGTLTNNLYQVTLLNTGPDPVQDIAGNTVTSSASEQFAVDVPALQQNLFVEEGFATNTGIAEGTRENPYSTIGAAMTAAVPGDVVAVLPGVYTEQVTLKQFVRLLSASPSSTDKTVFTTSTGDALSTIIRAPFVASPPAGTYATVTATNLESFSGLNTEVAGFSIASPLVSDPANGTINPNAVGVLVTNSDILIDKDYVIDAGTGIDVTTSGTTALTPRIENDGVIGNITGVVIDDLGGTTSATAPANLINNDFAFNTVGLDLMNTATTPMQAVVDSNIFWQNHDQTPARNGFAIFSTNPDEVSLRNNLFQGNGASDTSQVNATNDLGNGFSPALLGTTAQDALNNLGNFVGNPSFVFPIDPRPGSDGPGTFFLDADFQLTAASAAIDNAWEATAITTDFLGNSQVNSGFGFKLPGYGPRDIGAFEYNGTGGDPVGGAFRVVTTSLVPVSGALVANGATLVVPTAPSAITVTFSGNVNPQDISATDLVLSGSAVDASNPLHAISLTWIDQHTVEFNLAGNANLPGTLDVSVPSGAIGSATGTANLGYSDNVVLAIGTPAPPADPTPPLPVTPVVPPVTPVTPPPAPAPTGPVTPPPAPAPQGPLHTKKVHKVVHHPVKKVVHHPVKPVVVAKPKPESGTAKKPKK